MSQRDETEIITFEYAVLIAVITFFVLVILMRIAPDLTPYLDSIYDHFDR